MCCARTLPLACSKRRTPGRRFICGAICQLCRWLVWPGPLGSMAGVIKLNTSLTSLPIFPEHRVVRQEYRWPPESGPSGSCAPLAFIVPLSQPVHLAASAYTSAARARQCWKPVLQPSKLYIQPRQQRHRANSFDEQFVAYGVSSLLARAGKGKRDSALEDT